MNKALIGGIITILALITGIGVVTVNNNSRDDGLENTSTQVSSNDHESSGFMSAPDKSTEEIQNGEVMMDIKDFSFSQKSLRIKKGTTVTWTNRDTAKHDITPDTETDAFKSSKLLAKGESYSFTFDTAGKYSYICSPHPYMKASVEVIE